MAQCVCGPIDPMLVCQTLLVREGIPIPRIGKQLCTFLALPENVLERRQEATEQW